MDSNIKRSTAVWGASFAAIPLGAAVFTLLFSAISHLLQTLLNPHFGSLLSGVSGTMFVIWDSAVMIWMGALSGFALVHAFGRRFRFGVGVFVVAAAILTLYPIWIHSVAVLQYPGRKLWISTGGALLVWDMAVGALGCWMITQAKEKQSPS